LGFYLLGGGELGEEEEIDILHATEQKSTIATTITQRVAFLTAYTND